MLLGLEAEPALERADRGLERVVVERHQQAALVAHEVVMVMVVMLERSALVAGHTVADVDPRDESQVLEHLDAAVHAGDADRPADDTVLEPSLEPLVYLLNGEGAVLAREQLDQHLARTAATVTRTVTRSCAIRPRR